MVPDLHLISEDRYIINMYKFYFTTGLIHLLISVLMLLDLIGILEFSYSNFNEVSYIFMMYSIFYFFIPFLFLMPFLSKLIRYRRKNLWLSVPLLPWVSQFVFAGFIDYSQIFLGLAYVCFITYGIVGFAAGIHGLKLMKKHENLTLTRE